MIFQLNATMKKVEKPVSRTFEMDSASTFFQLHQVMQQLFDWESKNRYSFFMQREKAGKKETIEIGPKNRQEGIYQPHTKLIDKLEMLADWFSEEHNRLFYRYDDQWVHEIKLIGQLDIAYEQRVPVCINAEYEVPLKNRHTTKTKEDNSYIDRDEKTLIDDINQSLQSLAKEAAFSNELSNVWTKMLETSKKLLKSNPWKEMNHFTFVLDHPISDKLLQCIVLETKDKLPELIVLTGTEGIYTIMQQVLEENPETILWPEHTSIYFHVKEKHALTEEQYEVAAPYHVKIDNKQYWPVVTSVLHDDKEVPPTKIEASYLLVVMEAIISMNEYFKAGGEKPVQNFEPQMAVLTYQENGQEPYDAEMLPFTDQRLLPRGKPLLISEIEQRRLTKMKGKLLNMEFVAAPLKIPFFTEGEKRPSFPILLAAVNKDSGELIYHELLHEPLDPKMVQQTLIKIYHDQKAQPGYIGTDIWTFQQIAALEPYLFLNPTDDLALIKEYVYETTDNMNKELADK